ncbi:MAG: MBOAT family protein [Polyangia bacterium]
MVFSSTLFCFLFLPLVLALYHLGPRRLRNGVLLLASLLYYCWGEPNFLPILAAVVAANYVFGLLLSMASDPRRRKLLVGMAVALDLGVLAYFKYARFIVGIAVNVSALLPGAHHPFAVPEITLPLGISFFTFHVLSYVIDIYRRQVPAQRNPGLLGLYIVFFPQLIAGPIVRYHEISDQLEERRTTSADLWYGMRRFILGMGKKVLLANTIAPIADAIFALPTRDLTASLAWLGAGAYALQIYFDFSGYSDMAVGLARLFGFRFPENFDYPYVARSMTDFWRRWHQSLSRWFRDYLYLPLGGNRVSPARTYLNLALVFFLCGLWHGASWTFVMWGFLHGAFLVLERMGFGLVLAALWSPLRHLYCLVVIAITWVLFRAATLPMALAMVKAMIGLGSGAGTVYRPAIFVDHERTLVLLVAVVASTPAARWLRSRLAWRLDRWPMLVDLGRLSTLTGVLLLSLMQLSSGTYNPFIYFRF